MMRLLVLRPEPGSTATVERARRLGLDVLAIPLFEIEPLAWQAPLARFDGLLLTSASAVRHAGPQLGQLRNLPVYAVGEATAAAAREAGFVVAATGDGGADRLLGSVHPKLKLLHLCGADRKTPVGARQQITPVPVYQARPRKIQIGQLSNSVALIHSPRAAERFADLVHPAARGSISIAAISRDALGVAGEGWAGAEAAEKPNDDALLVLAARLCNKTAAQ